MVSTRYCQRRIYKHEEREEGFDNLHKDPLPLRNAVMTLERDMVLIRSDSSSML